MANRAALLKQADLTRYLAAVRKAGMEVRRVEIAPDGRVSVITGGTASEDGGNPCDRLLD